MNKRKITFGSLFRGIGGFDLGFEEAGMELAWAVEIDDDCNAVARRRWPGKPIVKDIREAGKKNLSRVDVICFGSPCQDFSVAGTRAGILGERSGLFHEAIRVIRELSPRLVVWENVPGVFSSFTPVDAPPSDLHIGDWNVDEDSDFLTILSAMADLRPVELAWRVLDSQWFGVAQRRRRVFLVADFGGERAAEILALAESLQGHPAPRRETGEGVAGSLESRTDGGGFPGTDGACAGHVVAAEVCPSLKKSGSGVSRPAGGGEEEAYIGVVPIQEVSKRTGKSTSDVRAGIGIGEEGDPMFTIQRGAQHGVALPATARTLSGNLSRGGIPSSDGLDGSMIPAVAGCPQERDAKGADSDTKPGHLIAVRVDNTSANGCGILEDGSAHTLGGAQEAVAFEPRIARNGRGAPDTIAPPLKAQSGRTGKGDGALCVCLTNRAPHDTLQLHGLAERVSNGNASEADAGEVLRILREANGAQAYEQWRTTLLASFSSAEVLRSAMLRAESGADARHIHFRKEQRANASAGQSSKGSLREVRTTKRKRCSPQRLEHEQQQTHESSTAMPVMSQPYSQDAKALQGVWKTAEGTRLLQSALSSLQEVGRSAGGEAQSISSAAERGRAVEKTGMQRGEVQRNGAGPDTVRQTLHGGQASRNASADNLKGGSGVSMIVRRLTPV